MADIASENDTDLHGDPDATHWAERFVLVRHNLLTGPEHRDIAGDADTMLAWFAGAIETGRMVEAKAVRGEHSPDDPAPEGG